MTGNGRYKERQFKRRICEAATKFRTTSDKRDFKSQGIQILFSNHHVVELLASWKVCECPFETCNRACFKWTFDYGQQITMESTVLNNQH